MSTLQMIGIDLAAMLVLVLGLYFPRHRRSDLVAAFLGVNVGVLAVATVLANSTVSAGLGLGLFGVLSIIRLRSTEISQGEIAYFFASLALGLLGGIQTAPLALVAILMTLVVASLWIGDSPRLAARNRHQVIQLDRAIADEAAFLGAVRQAAALAGAGWVATSGIEASGPSTAFGYIHCGGPAGVAGAPDGRRVLAFTEKPDAVTAAAYLATGDYRWNAGMFVVRAGVLLDHLAELRPQLAAGIEAIAAAWDTPEREEVLGE